MRCASLTLKMIGASHVFFISSCRDRSKKTKETLCIVRVLYIIFHGMKPFMLCFLNVMHCDVLFAVAIYSGAPLPPPCINMILLELLRLKLSGRLLCYADRNFTLLPYL